MRAIVVGLGNPYFEGDSAGIRVAEMAERSLAEIGVDIAILSTTSFQVIDRILGYDKAYIIDTLIGEEHGRIHVFRIEPGRLDVLDELEVSCQLYASHALSLTTTLKLGFELFSEEMPDIEVIAIEMTSIAEPDMSESSTGSDDVLRRAFYTLQQRVLAVMDPADSSPSTHSSEFRKS